MNTQRDKFLTEKVLGECWHNYVFIEDEPFGKFVCPECEAGRKTVAELENTDLSTPEGFFKLWNAAKEKDWWGRFIDSLNYSENVDSDLWQVMYHIHPDRFADALETFLKELMMVIDGF